MFGARNITYLDLESSLCHFAIFTYCYSIMANVSLESTFLRLTELVRVYAVDHREQNLARVANKADLWTHC